jgi:Domain of unknown function (DUF1788)
VEEELIMGQIEELADRYGKHIATPWQRTIAGAQRVVMVVHDKKLERTLRARKAVFEMATKDGGHDWYELDLSDAFARWIAADEYRDAYFEIPDDLQMKLDAEFADFVADSIRAILVRPEVSSDSVVAVFGVGALFGFTRMSKVLTLVEADIRGRLVIFFPGQFENNNYRLLDARDGWNYMAVPITLHTTGGNI